MSNRGNGKWEMGNNHVGVFDRRQRLARKQGQLHHSSAEANGETGTKAVWRRFSGQRGKSRR